MTSCGECLFLTNENFCQLAKTTVNISEGCALGKNRESVKQCSKCGNMILGTVTYDSKTLQPSCEACASLSGTCEGCSSSNYCAFMEDPNPLPQISVRTIRQGNVIIQKQGVNPDRVKATCLNGCPCADEKLGCLRQYGNCNKFEAII